MQAIFNNTVTVMNLTNGTNSTWPDTRPRRPPPLPELDIVGMVFFCILALIIVFENSLVIDALRVNRRLRTKANMLLVSLAIADMLMGIISIPLWVYVLATYTFRGPVYKIYVYFDVFSAASSILHLTAISLERCYALLYPIRHRNIRKRMSLLFNYSSLWLNNKSNKIILLSILTILIEKNNFVVKTNGIKTRRFDSSTVIIKQK